MPFKHTLDLENQAGSKKKLEDDNSPHKTPQSLLKWNFYNLKYIFELSLIANKDFHSPLKSYQGIVKFIFCIFSFMETIKFNKINILLPRTRWSFTLMLGVLSLREGSMKSFFSNCESLEQIEFYFIVASNTAGLWAETIYDRIIKRFNSLLNHKRHKSHATCFRSIEFIDRLILFFLKKASRAIIIMCMNKNKKKNEISKKYGEIAENSQTGV